MTQSQIGPRPNIGRVIYRRYLVSEAELETPLQEVAVTRASVKGLLVEGIEFTSGRKPMKLELTDLAERRRQKDSSAKNR